MKRSTPTSPASAASVLEPSTLTAWERLRVARAGGVAHDRGEVDHRSYVHERVRARSGVSDIPAKHPRTGPLEPLGQLDLAVEQRVEHRDVSSRREQPLAREQADVSGASCDQYSHARGFLRVRAVPA